MSARAKSPARGQSSNVDRASKNFSALKKIKKVLTVLLPLLVLHGENFPTAFAEWISSVKEHIRDLSMAERTELFKSDRDLTDDVGRLCLDAIDIVSDDWTVVKNLNGDHHKSIKTFLTAWLLTPCIQEFAGIMDENTVDIFTTFVIKCEDWKSAGEILLGQELNVKPLAMVVLLYDGVQEVVKAPETMLKRILKEGVKRVETYCTKKVGGGSAKTAADGSDSPAHVEKARDTYNSMGWWWRQSWRWMQTLYFVSNVLDIISIWSMDLNVKCEETYKENFEKNRNKLGGDAQYDILCYAVVMVMWHKIANACKPLEDAVDYTCYLFLVVAGTTVYISEGIPRIRCGVSASMQHETKSFIPTWAWLIVALYITEVVFMGLNTLYVSQCVKTRQAATHTAYFVKLCGCYVLLNFMSRSTDHNPIVRCVIILLLLSHFLETFNVETHVDNPNITSWLSLIAVRAMNALLVLVEMGAIGPLQSSDPQHLKSFYELLGAFHSDMAIFMLLYASMDNILPKYR